jgi:hypothetical protein
MTVGAIFKLISNDGKQDRMLMATELLNQRLNYIAKMRAGSADPTPTLVDIEKTHIIFTNSHFKPFAAMAYEYNEEIAQGGTPAFGQKVIFSISQFGDFFHDMAVRVSFSAATPAGSDTTVRYCQFPGQRLFKNVRFDVNGNPLDEYTSDVVTMYEKLFVTADKQVGWNKCVGQENPVAGIVESPSDGFRELRQVLNGPQTPKAVQPALELTIPLLFWFNKDPRVAVPSAAIPYGQRYIHIELASKAEICAGDSGAAADVSIVNMTILNNNIFVNPEVHDIFIRRIGFSLIRVHRFQSFLLSKASDSLLLNQIKWPVETMYVGFRPSDQTGLDDWHKWGKVTNSVVESCGASALAPQPRADAALTATTEVALEPAFASPGTGPADIALDADDPTVDELNAALVAAGYSPLTFEEGVVGTDVPTAAQINTAMTLTAACKINVPVLTSQVSTLSLRAHGVTLYRKTAGVFYNAYKTYHYGGYKVVTPEDPALFMINFCLYPGTYQPSGHINVSRAREFYLDYEAFAGEISESIVTQMFVVASALNFLLISDGSATLRYST